MFKKDAAGLRSIFPFMEIAVLLKRFCEEARQFRGYTDATIRRYRRTVEMFSQQTNIVRLEDITEERVRDWFFRGRAERHWSAQTFRTYHKSLNVFFRWCRASHYLAHDPLANLALPKLEQSLPRRLTREQALRLLEIAQNYPWSDPFLRSRNYAIIATFLFAGLRKNELVRLTVSDVDLDGLSIFVRRGKGRKDRIVPVSESLAEILVSYSRDRARRRKTAPEFFTKHKVNAGLTAEALQSLVRTLRESSGFSFSVHQLRHTFATLMLEGGCDIYSLSRMMGHEDISTTTIYLSASAEHLRAQIVKHPLRIGTSEGGMSSDAANSRRGTEAWERDSVSRRSPLSG